VFQPENLFIKGAFCSVVKFCDSCQGLVNSPRMYCSARVVLSVIVSKLIVLVTNNFFHIVNKKSQHDLMLNFDIYVFVGFPVGDLEFCFCVMLEDQNQILISLNILLKFQ
jgi:hypothetical protein